MHAYILPGQRLVFPVLLTVCLLHFRCCHNTLVHSIPPFSPYTHTHAHNFSLPLSAFTPPTPYLCKLRFQGSNVVTLRLQLPCQSSHLLLCSAQLYSCVCRCALSILHSTELSPQLRVCGYRHMM